MQSPPAIFAATDVHRFGRTERDQGHAGDLAGLADDRDHHLPAGVGGRGDQGA